MIYIHIPYCSSFCIYCDFYSEIPTCGFEQYVDALCGEITARREEIPWNNNTLYIGGGTPSVLPLKFLRRIVETLGADFEEFTIEVNPDDVVRRGEEYVRGLAELGVNRISMGVQSLNDNVLRWMNRRHNADQARRAYRIIRDAGIENISVDLIFGYNLNSINTFFLDNPQSSNNPTSSDREKLSKYNTFPTIENYTQNEEQDNAALELFRQTIDDILNIGGDGIPPKHISAYQLSIEPGSALAGMVADGRYTPASDELCARQYEILCERLAGAGYDHYEISNFAQPGFQSRHNSAYWRHIPYIGFGPAAHSFFIKPVSTTIAACHAGDTPQTSVRLYSLKSLNNKDIQTSDKSDFNMNAAEQAEKVQYIRLWNEPNVNSYLRAAQNGDFASISESETLTAEQIREERVMLALRTSAGIEVDELLHPSELDESLCAERDSSSPSALQAKVSAMLENGSLVRQGSRVRIPESKFFVSDDIISDLI